MIIENLHQVYLGLGSNLGNKEENLRKAISMINEQIGTVVRQSAFFYSEPWGYESDNQFVNAVILVETSLSPYDVLTANQCIEHLLGKTQAHATERPSDLSLQPSDLRPPIYHDRPIDIDILLYDDLHMDEPGLKIPHPLMEERDFVMIPLNEIRK
ncbi:2-amino-4-hydroxy-6-hydroxymethyldihydropteridine diphosphokinase [Prevotella communis]|nr:2-amino-4-hydroxy-6-hydroxymethyldihydropteridine diphosphokinase [Prevotella communis]UKK56096.1 2-amino-4-hydroxy-6-hydroxymethyldihydropteridine diphosphokinase [Prevotella communis]